MNNWTRGKSPLIFFLFLVVGLLTGCGGSGSTFSDPAVFTGSNIGPSSATFNFIRAQAPLEVPQGTIQIRFQFFSGPGGTGIFLQNEVRDFAATITISPVDTESRSVVITALGAGGELLARVTKDITLLPGQNINVDCTDAVPELPILATLTVTPDGDMVVQESNTAFAVVGTDQFGQPFALAPNSVVWSISDGNAATIDAQTGVATGLFEGVVTVRATVGGVFGEARLNVLGPGDITGITSVTPNPVMLTLDAGDNTETLTTTASFQNIAPEAITNAENGLTYMVTGNPDVVSVDNDGLITALAQGTTVVTASVGTFSSNVDVTVDFGMTVNADPTLTLDTVALGFESADPAILAFPNAAVTDPNQAASDGGTLTVESRDGGNQNVVITVPTTPAIGTIQNNGTTSVTVTLNGLATPANIQQVLRGTLIDATAAGPGQLDVTLDDGQGGNAMASRDFCAIVVGPLTLAPGNYAFNTDTGELNGVLLDGWCGSFLALSSLDIQAGATITVTGSQAFDVSIDGNGTVAGVIVANGAAGANALNNQAGGAGGAGGPGGFGGGLGGGSNGEPGLGPGGGGGGINVAGSAGPSKRASGGGGGHSVAGGDGVTGIDFNSNVVVPPATADPGLTAGLGGAAYTSIPALLGGSGGGGGAFDNDGGSGDDGGGGGGGGGGVVRLTCTGTLNVSGTISCSGGAGGGGENGGGGGGGSGGTIWLRAVLAVPTVSGMLNVDGGAASPILQANSPAPGGAGALGVTLVEQIAP